MKLTNNHYAFLTSATCGFLIWYFSKQITGNSEPWDGNFLAYLFSLLAVGFLCVYLFNSNLKAVYWGAYLGQALVIGGPFFWLHNAWLVLPGRSQLISARRRFSAGLFFAFASGRSRSICNPPSPSNQHQDIRPHHDRTHLQTGPDGNAVRRRQDQGLGAGL
jgi:hypothetical protein